jgi:hypothetical protein
VVVRRQARQHLLHGVLPEVILDEGDSRFEHRAFDLLHRASGWGDAGR